MRRDPRPLLALARRPPRLSAMRIPTTVRILAACLALLALPAASAHANASDDRIVEDCQTSATGLLTGSYTKAQLNHALRNLPSDVAEYSGCYDAIRQAMTAGAHGGGTGGDQTGGSGDTGGTGGGGSTGTGGTTGGTGASGAGAAPDPQAVAAAKPPPGAEEPVQLAGAEIAPGALPEIGRDSHALPAPLLVLLVLLGVAALAAGALTIGRRVVARRRP
jgi:hypothetical protein